MVAAEISAGISSLRLAYDIAKGMKDIADATERNSKVLELQGAIMDAQAGAIEAQQAHSTDIKRIAQLEEEIARMKTWEGEKQRYELKGASDGLFAYMLKPEARGTEPAHWVCTNCYEQGKKSILQLHSKMQVGRMNNFKCPGCNAMAQTSEHGPRWL